MVFQHPECRRSLISRAEKFQKGFGIRPQFGKTTNHPCSPVVSADDGFTFGGHFGEARLHQRVLAVRQQVGEQGASERPTEAGAQNPDPVNGPLDRWNHARACACTEKTISLPWKLRTKSPCCRRSSSSTRLWN